ncbi:glycerophosphodiester phosphodiesterase [Candidatus Sumerlaeota bacterium]
MATKITAHRGLPEKYPESTLVSFREAARAGADRIELDAHLTADGQVVIHHDYNLGRIDDGKGLIFERDYAYLAALDVGSHFDLKYTGERMPLLREVFEELGSEIEYELELKDASPDLSSAVLGLVDEFGLLAQIEFTSPHHYVLPALREQRPEIRTGKAVGPFPEWMPLALGQRITKHNLLLGGINVVHCPVSNLTVDSVSDFHESGLGVHVDYCNTPTELQMAFLFGVDGLTTDRLELAVDMRNAMSGK